MTREYKCPCCGGTISFDSDTQKMKCPYCDSLFDVESLKEYDEVLEKEKESSDSGDFKSDGKDWTDDGLMHYVCSSCGGEIITNETLASTVCPYCSNNVILTDKLEGVLKPDLVIPFSINKEKAVEIMRKNMKGKLFLNKAFRDEGHLTEVKGVYVPVWLYSSPADASITYRAVTTDVWFDRDFTYTKTNHYLLEREGSVTFDKIPVDGSKNMSDELMEALGPYDYSRAVDFQTAYLSGFLADKYDMTSAECKPRAIERAKVSVEKCFNSTTEAFQNVRKESGHITLTGGDVKYALLPVWLLNTKWKERDYLFCVNGENGKFVGDLPFDTRKGIITFLISTGIIGALFLLGFYAAWAM